MSFRKGNYGMYNTLPIVYGSMPLYVIETLPHPIAYINEIKARINYKIHISIQKKSPGL